TFVGVNFSELQAYFGERAPGQWLVPSGDSRGIHSRLLGCKLATETATRFYECFSDAAYQQLQEPIDKARACAKSGRYELAATYYQDAIRRQPRNWVLLNEVSMFLTFQMRDPRAGADLAKVALGLNPTCSADLWSTLGDALYELGRTKE